MENLCYKLKQQLEKNFSMPFEVTSSSVDGEIHYTCWPANEDQMFFNVMVYIHNQIRLIVEIYPQTHGGYILNEMALASAEKRKCFFAYKQMLMEKGAKIKFLVNNNNLTEEEWPSRWKSFYVKITKVPIPESTDSDFSITLEWMQHGIDLVFSLLTISDISENDIFGQAVQTEGTPQEIRSIRYERNHINRELCLHMKGHSCAVCGMNFFDTYGIIGKDFIEVHHTTPVSEMDEDFVLNIERDLVPLCSNCHSMVHRKKPPYSIHEMKMILEENSYGGNWMVAEDIIEYNKEKVSNLIVGVVKSDRISSFINGDATSYYFGKKFPSKYNLKNIQFFAPYYNGGIRGYYEISAIRTATKSEIIGNKEEYDKDLRIVLELGKYHVLSEQPIKIKLANYTYANLSLDSIKDTNN